MPEISAPARPRVAVAVPVYNHAATLRSVVEGVRDVLAACDSSMPLANPVDLEPRVIVVDDGSSDNPENRLQGLDVLLCRHEQNQGKGAAILTAARLAQELGCTHLVTLDADGQHDPADLPRFFQALAREPHALHVGRRCFANKNVPASSRFGRRFSNFWLRVHTGHKLGDSQSGFRAYPLELFSELSFRDRRYSFEVEVLAKAAWAGVMLRDVEISVHYPPPNERISHFKPFRDNLRISLLNTRLTMRSLLPWPHKRLRPISEDNSIQPGFTVIRPVDSVRELLRQGVPPRELFLSGFLGMWLGALPLIGLHTIAVLLTAAWFGRNKFVALGVNQLCIPPLVPALCIEVGYFMRHGRLLTEISLQTLGYQAPQRLYEWLLGGLVMGPILGLLVGGALYLMARTLKMQRKAARQRG